MNSCETNRVFASEADSSKPERDSQGRFVAGNSGGPGNPFGRHVAALRMALLGAVTDEDMQALARKLIDMAIAGSIPAMKLLLQYSIGKPAPAPNPDHVEIEEWDYFKKTADMTEDVGKVIRSLEPEVVLDMGREVRPIMSEQQMNRIKAAFATGDVGILDGKGRKKSPPSRNGFDGPTSNGSGEQFDGDPTVNGFDGGSGSDGPGEPSTIGDNGPPAEVLTGGHERQDES